MGLFKPSYTIDMPDQASVSGSKASWKIQNGESRSGTITANGRVLVRSGVWWMIYRDEDGRERRESTGVSGKESAIRILHKREDEIEKIKSGVLSRSEIKESRIKSRPISEFVEKFRVSLEASGDTEKHVKSTIRKINHLSAEIGLRSLPDVSCEKMEGWISGEIQSGKRAPRTINSYLVALGSFLNWCTENGYITSSPIRRVKKLNEAVGRRKERRSLTEDELRSLLEFASRNEENSLVYRVLAGTGLRSGELAASIPAQFDFDRCTFRVRAVTTKNKKNDILPIRPDLAVRLKEWITSRGIKPGERVFSYTIYSIYREFMKDCLAVGIARQDDSGKIVTKGDDGRSVDVHSLRRTFGTMLARAGVPLTTTQRLMRHSTPELTARIYIDVEPIDMLRAVERLPSL